MQPGFDPGAFHSNTARDLNPSPLHGKQISNDHGQNDKEGFWQKGTLVKLLLLVAKTRTKNADIHSMEASFGSDSYNCKLI